MNCKCISYACRQYLQKSKISYHKKKIRYYLPIWAQEKYQKEFEKEPCRRLVLSFSHKKNK